MYQLSPTQVKIYEEITGVTCKEVDSFGFSIERPQNKGILFSLEQLDQNCESHRYKAYEKEIKEFLQNNPLLAKELEYGPLIWDLVTTSDSWDVQIDFSKNARLGEFEKLLSTIRSDKLEEIVAQKSDKEKLESDIAYFSHRYGPLAQYQDCTLSLTASNEINYFFDYLTNSKTYMCKNAGIRVSGDNLLNMRIKLSNLFSYCVDSEKVSLDKKKLIGENKRMLEETLKAKNISFPKESTLIELQRIASKNNILYRGVVDKEQRSLLNPDQKIEFCIPPEEFSLRMLFKDILNAHEKFNKSVGNKFTADGFFKSGPFEGLQ